MKTWSRTFPCSTGSNAWCWVSVCCKASRASWSLELLFLAMLMQLWELNVPQVLYFDTCSLWSFLLRWGVSQAGFLSLVHFSPLSNWELYIYSQSVPPLFYLKCVVFFFLYFFPYLTLKAFFPRDLLFFCFFSYQTLTVYDLFYWRTEFLFPLNSCYMFQKSDSLLSQELTYFSVVYRHIINLHIMCVKWSVALKPSALYFLKMKYSLQYVTHSYHKI